MMSEGIADVKMYNTSTYYNKYSIELFTGNTIFENNGESILI